MAVSLAKFATNLIENVTLAIKSCFFITVMAFSNCFIITWYCKFLLYLLKQLCCPLLKPSSVGTGKYLLDYCVSTAA